MSSDRSAQTMLALAHHALDSGSESEWWDATGAAVTGSMFAALVMTVNVVNAAERYGWFSVVRPIAAQARIPVNSAMDSILTADHPFSLWLRDHPVHDPLQVTDLVSDRQWKARPSYARMRELTDGAHHLLVPLPHPAPYVESVSIVRADRAFDEAELARARQLQTVISLATSHLRHVADRGRRWGPRFERDAANAANALGLTARERVVLDLLSQGIAARVIASRLHVSRRTVDKHRQNLYRKLSVSDQVNALLRARRLGLVPDPMIEAEPLPKPAGLSARERSVLDLLATGMTNSAIGDALQLRVGTVNVHVGNVLTKLGARTRTEAVALALRNRFVV